AMGVLFVLIFERGLLSEAWRPLLMVGFLGAFTTFSTFSLQTIGLLQEGRLLTAAIYTIGSVLLSIAAAYLAMITTRTLSG
ncbi:MAG: CrcB family protein, partial [Gammaproteobacteria bacterium]|nr:CrcB family protein [Gammaproteobacteria bacterium]